MAKFVLIGLLGLNSKVLAARLGEEEAVVTATMPPFLSLVTSLRI